MWTLTKRIACALLIGAALPAETRAQWSTEALSSSRAANAGVASGGKAYFAGGVSLSDVVDVYDEASGAWSQEALSSPRSHVAATAVDKYVLFAGGATSNTTSSAVVDVLDTQTMLWSTVTLSQARITSATTVGNKAIFAGGYSGGFANPASSDAVDIYDAALGAPDQAAAWSTATLSVARGRLAATSAGDLAFFAGGRDDVLAGGNHSLNTVDIYDDSDGTWSTATLSKGRHTLAAASTASRAFFGGGEYGNQVSDVVDIYDVGTGGWFTTTLSQGRSQLSAAAVDDRVLFAGGFVVGGGATATVDIFDGSAGIWGPTAALSFARGGMGATAVGSKALFAGGVGAAGITDEVDVYNSLWTDLGGSTAGITGVPTLTGLGSLTGGDLVTVTLSNALPGAVSYFVAGFSAIFAPLKGGVLVPMPDLLFSGITLDGLGQVTLTTTWPTGLPPGIVTYYQFWVPDAAGPVGFSASNGLSATTP